MPTNIFCDRRNDLNPCICRIWRLIFRRACSIRLFRYLLCLMVVVSSSDNVNGVMQTVESFLDQRHRQSHHKKNSMLPDRLLNAKNRFISVFKNMTIFAVVSSKLDSRATSELMLPPLALVHSWGMRTVDYYGFQACT